MMVFTRRCLECPFYRPNAEKLNDWHLEEACEPKKAEE